MRLTILCSMGDVLSTVGEGLKQSFLMAYEVWWALVLGFAISGDRPGLGAAGADRGDARRAAAPGRVAWATGLGAASSSCSYAAIAIAKSLFQKGASAATALAFQFASTNLVWELGLVLWVLIGWQFTLAEYVGGIVMIVLMTVLLRAFVSPRLEEQARAPRPGGGGRPRSTTPRATRMGLRASGSPRPPPGPTSPTTSAATGRCSGRRSRSASCSPASSACSATTSSTASSSASAAGWLNALENVIVGPLIAVLSFVCSVGNVPLAAVLWSGGISFAGVMAFIFADLIVLPIVAIYRKYYGWPFTLRIVALMFVTMVVAALIVDGLFSALPA